MANSALLKRCQGPRALPLALLISRGDQAAQIVCLKFGDHLQEALSGLQDAVVTYLAQEASDTAKAKLLTIVRDLRSSSATAGQEWVSIFAASLETSLEAGDIAGQNLSVLIGLHMDALHVAAKRITSAEELVQLQQSLLRVQMALR